ncbi:MAG TPA: alpha/beta hydrolase [Acidimicrobiia bacterium]|nr:alpha/beta hydrolase [Acidimicrobiia bacterium]
MRKFFRALFWLLVAVVVVAHAAGGWYYSDRIIDEAFTPNPGATPTPNGAYEVEEVTYETPLGDMDAWYLPASGSTWVIHVHGLNATPAEPEVLFAPLQDAGYPQLSIAYRNDQGQPADPSGYFQYGVTEWEDILGAAEYAAANGAERIVFAGYSTGASHILSFVYKHDFNYIAGLVTDSGNIDLGSTVDYQGSFEDLPNTDIQVPVTMAWVAKFFTSLRININWKSLDYIEKAKRSLRVPILAFHGTADESVPISESTKLAEAQSDLVEVVTVEGAGHVDSFNADFDGYVSRLLQFLDDVG